MGVESSYIGDGLRPPPLPETVIVTNIETQQCNSIETSYTTESKPALAC